MDNLWIIYGYYPNYGHISWDMKRTFCGIWAVSKTVGSQLAIFIGGLGDEMGTVIEI